jgi:hypothetical protein
LRLEQRAIYGRIYWFTIGPKHTECRIAEKRRRRVDCADECVAIVVNLLRFAKVLLVQRAFQNCLNANSAS